MLPVGSENNEKKEEPSNPELNAANSFDARLLAKEIAPLLSATTTATGKEVKIKRSSLAELASRIRWRLTRAQRIPEARTEQERTSVFDKENESSLSFSEIRNEPRFRPYEIKKNETPAKTMDHRTRALGFRRKAMTKSTKMESKGAIVISPMSKYDMRSRIQTITKLIQGRMRVSLEELVVDDIVRV